MASDAPIVHSRRKPPNPAPSPSAELKLMIQTQVSAEVQAQLDRERIILRDAGILALKIVGAAFALLLAIFTVFGLTTWRDVANQTTDYMKQRVDNLIQSSDSETGVKQTLNDLVNRSIVASELASLSRQQGKALDLPKFEWDRLKAWVKFESLGIQEFSDTLGILNAQAVGRKKADANGFLSEMLSPPDTSPYRWITKQPDKRLAIMSNFKHADLGASALAIAQSTAVSEDLRLAAITYIRDVNYTEGFDKLIALASGADDGPLKTQALLTSAKLNPANRLFLAEMMKLMSQPTFDSISSAAQIVDQLWAEGDPFPNDIDSVVEMQVLTTSKELLSFAFRSGAYLQLDTLLHTIRPGNVGPTNPSFSILVPMSKTSARFEGSWTLDGFSKLKPYWALLTDAANGGDKNMIAEYMFSSFGPTSSSAGVTITLGANSSLQVKDDLGNELVLKAGDATAILLLPVRRGSSDLPVQWSKGPTSNKGTILQFSGGGFSLSLHQDAPGAAVRNP